MKKRLLFSLLMITFCAGPFTALAADEKQVTCAAIKIFECTSANGCSEVSAESVDLPQMFRINFTTKTITGIIDGKERITPIESLEYIDGKLMLQGAEDGQKEQKDGVAWNGVINEMTGTLVFSASGDNFSISIFGTCIPR